MSGRLRVFACTDRRALGAIDMARPSKLTRETQDRIVLALRAGNHLSVAARAAGLSEATVYRWLKARGSAYRAFAAAVERAIAESEVVLVATIAQGAARNPGVALKMLERRHPDRWGRIRVELSAPIDSLQPDPQRDGNPTAARVNELTLPPEWTFVINKVITAAALGHSPDEFFERADRFVGLREDALPPGPWWREPGEPVDASRTSDVGGRRVPGVDIPKDP
jgi:hypothetical protein